ncbi:MAG: hypothetical protein WBF87_11940 [Mesorhizobium sp.]
MLSNNVESKESKAEKTDRVAREIIAAERIQVLKKVQRLRDKRLKVERISGL